MYPVTPMLNPADYDPTARPLHAVVELPRFRSGWAILILALLVMAYIALFSTTSILGFRNFGMSAYDIGIHDQAVWKLATGRGVFNTIRGLNIWGDHCWFIMIFLAPFYWIAPRLETILVLQSVAMGLAAAPLAVLAHRRSNSYILALLLALAWLLSPTMQNMNLENFHPEILAAPFLLWAVERADVKKWRLYGVAVAFALLCKEDVALTTFALGFWVFLRRSWRAGLITMIVSLIWFGLCMKVFLPYYNDHGFFRFEGGYWFSTFWTHKWEPAFYAETFTTPKVGDYGWKLMFPLLFAPALSPVLILAAAPEFAVNVLSRNDYLISIVYHYNFKTLPMLFAATALGLAWLMRCGRWGQFAAWPWAAGIVACSVWANVQWSYLPLHKSLERVRSQYRQLTTTTYDARFKRMAAFLPKDPDVPICASHNFVPHLCHRNEIYMFPNPYQVMYWGIKGENLPKPDRIRALFIDRSTLSPEIAPVAKRLLASGEFKIVAEEGSLFVATWQPPPERRPIADPATEPAPEKGVRVLVYIGSTEVTALTSLVEKTPDLDLNAEVVGIPPIYDRNIATGDGIDLGAAKNLRVVFIGQWQARGQSDTIFRIRVDDGCRLYVDEKLVLDRGGVNSLSYPKESEPVRLTPGPHKIRLDYFQWGGEAGLVVEYRSAPDGAYKPLRTNVVLP